MKLAIFLILIVVSFDLSYNAECNLIEDPIDEKDCFGQEITLTSFDKGAECCFEYIEGLEHSSACIGLSKKTKPSVLKQKQEIIQKIRIICPFDSESKFKYIYLNKIILGLIIIIFIL